MSDVDVITAIEIARPREHVAAYVADPDNAPRWYVNIKSAEPRTAPPLHTGSRIAFVASFMGRRLEYVYEITELVPNERMVMRTTDGPFAMETTYTWADAGAGRTRMALRNRGRPSGFAAVLRPVLQSSMRRANRKDLARLRSILEREAPATTP